MTNTTLKETIDIDKLIGGNNYLEYTESTIVAASVDIFTFLLFTLAEGVNDQN